MKTVKEHPVLILGASGFIGSELMNRLIKSKKQVIALARNPGKIKRRSKYLTLAKGDILDSSSYSHLLDRVQTIYYFIHAMDNQGDFEALESKQARVFASKLTKKHRVVYLSGLGEPKSFHIRSRQKVGEILINSVANAYELRASIVIGSGSLSFEMIYGIVRRFPFTVKTDWSEALCEPIALGDILFALESLGDPQMTTQTQFKPGIYEIGNGTALPYSSLMMLCAQVQGRDFRQLYIPRVPKRIVLEVMRFMLPEYYQVGSLLMGSIEIPTSVQSENILELLGRRPTSLKVAMKRAVTKSQKNLKHDFSWHTKIEDLLSTLPASLRVKLKYSYKALKALNNLRRKI